jgi:hypothetical protein
VIETLTLTETVLLQVEPSSQLVKVTGTWNSGGVHPFSGSTSGLRTQEVPHVNKDSTPITVFLCFFMKMIQLLVADTTEYYNQYLDTLSSDGR